MLRPFSTAAGFDFLTAGVSREDFRRAGDRSSDAKADITLTQVIMANESQVFSSVGDPLLSFRSKMLRRHGQARARGIRSSLHVLLVQKMNEFAAGFRENKPRSINCAGNSI